MKVAQISTWQVPCGIAGYTAGLSEALQDSGIQCDVFPIDRTRLKYSSKKELHEYYAELADAVRGYDVVHIQHEFGFFWGSSPSLTLPVFAGFLRRLRSRARSTFVTFHSEPYLDARQFPAETRFLPAKQALMRGYWSARIAPEFLAGARAIVHTKMSRLALLRSGLPAGSVELVRQGTPPPREPASPEERRAAKERLGLPPDAVVLTIFGFVTRHKGYTTMLEALRHLPREYHLVILGGPHPFSPDLALDDILQWQRRRPKDAKRMTLTGYLPFEEVEEHLRATDIAVAPYREWPRVSSSAALTWALAAGRPIVASRVPAFEEIQDEYACLHLTVPEATGELAYRIQELAADEALQAELVARGHEYCTAHSWARAAEEHVRLYERATGVAAARRPRTPIPT
ncbi:MAG: hypothetical protein QOE36_879 [Gaiellaceae bacterium]|nr:hypothetical protein [Gaiellaceae bacterium]